MRTQRPGLRLLSIASAVALVLGACSPAETPVPSATSSDAAVSSDAPVASGGAPSPTETVAGGDFVFTTGLDATTLDALWAVGVDEFRIDANLYDNLVYMSADTTIVPGLATSWTTSEDGLVYEFTLRDGVTFHNGDPLDAGAVKASFDRFLSEDLTGRSQTVSERLAGAEVIAPNQVRLRLKTPSVDFLGALALPQAGITDAAYVAKVGKDKAGQEPVGSGPFMFDSWTPGERIVLKRNPAWIWGNPDFFGTSGPASLDTLTFQVIPDSQTRVAALRAGDVQFADLIPFQDVGDLGSDPNLKLQGVSLPGMPQGHYINSQVEPTDDINVRRAMNLAVDREEIVKTLYLGLVKPAYSPLSADFANDYNTDMPAEWAYNPERANQLLDEAGWIMNPAVGYREKDGKPLKVTIYGHPTWHHWAVLLQAQLVKVGFATDLRYSGATFGEVVDGKANLPADGAIFTSPAGLETMLGRTGSATITAKLADEKLFEMLEQISAETDLAARSQQAKDVQAYIMDQGYFLPIYDLVFFSAFAKDVIGWVPDGTGFNKYFAGATMGG